MRRFLVKAFVLLLLTIQGETAVEFSHPQLLLFDSGIAEFWHFPPLPLKAFKGPFVGVALFEPKLAEIRPSQRI